MTNPVAQHTPLMAQYHSIKSQYPDALLFFQVGDFYELFFDDAIRASHFLSITLTSRGKNAGVDIPLCGVPVHALQPYVSKLVKGGFSVALCDQTSKPQPGTVVERAVTRVYTPGTLTDDSLLSEKTASYLVAIATTAQGYFFSAVELLTAQLTATQIEAGDMRSLEAELSRYMPDEILLQTSESGLATILKKWGFIVSLVTPLDEQEANVSPSTGLLHRYLSRVQPAIMPHLSEPIQYAPDQYVLLDAATQRNLAIVVNGDEGSTAHTLCRAVDKTVTAMGARLLKKWLVRPLRDADRIAHRQNVVQLFFERVTLVARVEEVLSCIADMERIVGRMVLGRAGLGDYRALKHSLLSLSNLMPLLESHVEAIPLFGQVLENMGHYQTLYLLLEESIYEGAEEEWLIKPGYSVTLDAARSLSGDGHAHIQRYSAEQSALHDISSLKILYTSVAGYFIEVTKTHTHKVPESYRHIQTLSGRERYVTAELSALERALEQARQEVQTLEKDLYARVQAEVKTYAGALRRTAAAIASLDVLRGFAAVATAYRYVRPVFTQDHHALSIMQGRHPVVEQVLAAGMFVANDTALGQDANVWIITGPNMGGKSTYLRQVALISLLAQCGSFVPAQSATLSLVDRIFTRIGAGDNVAQGKSTFLVEMEEAATICIQATPASLVILDEVGRGTSTEDGRALAQAIIEYLAHRVGALTLFATHYHELTALAPEQSNMANYHVVCVKEGEKIHFLHRVEPGIAGASFGVEVAQLAGLPPSIIARARELLKKEDVV